MDVLTLARYSSIAALVLRDRVPTLSIETPRRSAPIDFTVDLMWERTCVDVIRTSLFPVQNVLTVVRLVAFG